MKLYSNKITAADVREAFITARMRDGADIYSDGIRAFRAQQVTTYSMTARGPHKHTHRFNHGVQFYAHSMNGRQATGHRAIGSYPLDDVPRAASWDAYGYVIARLFLIDPDAVIGNYAGVADFIRQVEAANRKEPKDFLDLVQ